ncbi:MAG: membrane integrity-associated transporter subunit PqiC, partial [bacterium]
VGNISLDFQIIVEVRQFEMNSQSAVILVALWQIVREEDKASLLMKRSEFMERVNAERYESIVAGMSKVNADLSREIGRALNSLTHD